MVSSTQEPTPAASQFLRGERDPDPASLARLLLFGTAETRLQVASLLLVSRDDEVITLLAETIASNEPWLLRSRCLEVLGIVAGAGDRDLSESILRRLCPRKQSGPNKGRGTG